MPGCPLALAVQVAIAATGAVALISAAFAVAYTTPGGWTALRTVEDAPRRRLVGVLLILAAPLAALSIGLVLHEADAQTVLLPSAVVALAVAGVAVRVAPGVIPGARTLALCLGLFTLVYAGFNAAQYDAHPAGVDEFGNTVEIAPPVEWGAHAVAPFVGTLAAEQFGAIAAFFAVGIVLLGASAVLLVRRGRHVPG